jgi:hypothetical protein
MFRRRNLSCARFYIASIGFTIRTMQQKNNQSRRDLCDPLIVQIYSKQWKKTKEMIEAVSYVFEREQNKKRSRTTIRPVTCRRNNSQNKKSYENGGGQRRAKSSLPTLLAAVGLRQSEAQQSDVGCS